MEFTYLWPPWLSESYHLRYMVVGKDYEREILNDLVAFQKTLTQDGQMRWIGPECALAATAL